MSCDSLRTQVVPRQLANEPEKLVVSCFISPQDTLLAARLSVSRSLLGTNNGPVDDVVDATVSLSDGTRSVILRGRPEQGLNGHRYTSYRADARQLPIVAGLTYTLRVSTPGGRAVLATCSVPSAVALADVSIDSLVFLEKGQLVKDYYARLRWPDPVAQTNYYRIAGNNEYLYEFAPSGSNPGPVQKGRGDWHFQASTLLNDTRNDGGEMVSVRGRLFTPSLWDNGQVRLSRPVGQLNAYLLSIDENYYRYHDALERQAQTADNPFAEPVLLPTNIQGGLGCFGAYNRVTRTLTIN